MGRDDSGALPAVEPLSLLVAVRHAGLGCGGPVVPVEPLPPVRVRLRCCGIRALTLVPAPFRRRRGRLVVDLPIRPAALLAEVDGLGPYGDGGRVRDDRAATPVRVSPTRV